MKRKTGICSLIISAIGGAIVLLIYLTGCVKPCCIGFVLTTDSVSSITATTAQCGGKISSDDDDTVMVRGVCWSTRQSPTVELGDTTSDGIGEGIFTSLITGLAPLTRYYVRAYVTNRKGSTYGDEKSFKTDTAPVFRIGESYGGGIIFFIDTTGVHGLIAAKTDEKNAVWGCAGVLIAGGDVDSVGGGKKNTDTIIYGCKEPDIAAWICKQFVSLNYKDCWFLPSKEELHLLYLQKKIVGSFADDIYWSSTQSDKDAAWGENFTSGNGVQEVRNKNSLFRVRAIRAF